LPGQGLADDPAFAQAVAADEDEETEMAAGIGTSELWQVLTNANRTE
jgi:hypothetical protein